MSDLERCIIKNIEYIINTRLSQYHLGIIRRVIGGITQDNVECSVKLIEKIIMILSSFIIRDIEEGMVTGAAVSMKVLEHMLETELGDEREVKEIVYNVQSLLGRNTLNKVIKNYKRAYVALDTSNYIRKSNRSITWGLTYGSIITPGTCCLPDDMGNIYVMRIHDYVLADYSPDQTMGIQTVFVENFLSQSYLLDNRRFHFWGSIGDYYNLYNLYPTFDIVEENMYVVQFKSHSSFIGEFENIKRNNCYNNNSGKYIFNQPVRLNEEITLSFGDPFNIIDLSDKKIIIGMEFYYIEEVKN